MSKIHARPIGGFFTREAKRWRTSLSVNMNLFLKAMMLVFCLVGRYEPERQVTE